MSVERVTERGGMESSFGFAPVDPGEKQDKVNEVFHKVAKRYDLMNDLMSAGMHAFVAWLAPPKRTGWEVLNVAGGTGDIAFRIIEASGGKAHATVLDINGSMLSVGKDRAEKRRLSDSTDFVEANAEVLPFPDKSFDAYTIAFGIRNVTRIDLALAEAYRVLRHGGRFFCLEFSTTEWPGFKEVYDLYSHKLVPRIGEAIAGDADSYRYLIESIRRFPAMPEFEAMIRQAGFARTKIEPILGGLVAIHSGWKI
jgi:demethylmenaquinone methyltransferase / 2-methoxy-6-polyprenyl-1,4-benzoquinol methylase